MAHVYKMNSFSQVFGLMIIHNDRSKEDPEHERTRENGNIDPARSHLNYNLVERENAWEYFKDRQEKLEEERVKQTGQHLRKDAVRACSFIVYLPEDRQQRGEDYERQFFKGCVNYTAEQFGKDNIISAIVHKDENRPHIHIIAIPCTREPDKSGREFERISFKDAFNREDFRNMHPMLQEHCRRTTHDKDLKIYDEEHAKRRTTSKEEYIREKEEERAKEHERRLEEQDRKQIEKALKDTPEIKKNIFGKVSKEEEDRIREEQAKTARAAKREVERAKQAEERAKEEKDKYHTYREIELQGRLSKTEKDNVNLRTENQRLQRENDKLRQQSRFLDYLRQSPQIREIEKQFHDHERQRGKDHEKDR